MAVREMKNTRQAYATIRKGNRKTEVSFWAKGRRFSLAAGTGFLLIMFAMGFVWTNHQAVQTGYDIATLKSRQLRFVDTNRRLKLELANLGSIDRLENLAKNKLRLNHPRPDQVVVIK